MVGNAKRAGPKQLTRRLALLVIAALLAASPFVSTAAASTFRADHPTVTAKTAGNWSWWGYRTNAWQTWAIATQSPSYVAQRVVPFLSAYVYVQAWIWKLTAQNARAMGQCLGITWSASGIIVGCSNS